MLIVYVSIQTVVQDVSPEQIKGIGFDATCSLVVLDADFKPVTVSPTGEFFLLSSDVRAFSVNIAET